jgi:hypothetical protein
MTFSLFRLEKPLLLTDQKEPASKSGYHCCKDVCVLAVSGVLRPMLSRLTLALAIIILASGVLLVAIHLDDLYAVHHVPGIWMALAQSLNQGVFYPPLESAGRYAGTRYSPLFFISIAGLSWLTPGYLAAAKLAAVFSVGLLLAGLFTAIRRIGGKTIDAMTLACLLLAFPQGLAALLLPHADALAAGLAVWGLLALPSQTRKGRLGLAAFLFTLAVLTKFSTLAAPAAGFFWLLGRDRKRSLYLLALCLVLGGLALGLIEWSSQGRFLENLRQLGSGGATTASLLQGPTFLLDALRQSPGFAALLPFLFAAVVVRLCQGQAGLWDGYFLASAGMCLLIYTSPGTADNHLLELQAAGVLLLGQLMMEAQPTGLLLLFGPLARFLFLLLFGLAVWLHLGSWQRGEADGVVALHSIDDVIPRNACLLAESPTIPVLLGQRPVVMDAFAFRLLAERGRIDDEALAHRIRRHEFDVLILLGRIDRPGETLCPRIHFGPRVTQAILDSYRFDRRFGVYALFVRKEKIRLATDEHR